MTSPAVRGAERALEHARATFDRALEAFVAATSRHEAAANLAAGLSSHGQTYRGRPRALSLEQLADRFPEFVGARLAYLAARRALDQAERDLDDAARQLDATLDALEARRNVRAAR